MCVPEKRSILSNKSKYFNGRARYIRLHHLWVPLSQNSAYFDTGAKKDNKYSCKIWERP